MLTYPGDIVRFEGFFQSATTGLGAAGLAVKVSVNQGTSAATGLAVANSITAPPLDPTNQPGRYYYDFTVPAGYYGSLEASFTTTDVTVVQRGVPSLYLSEQWVEQLVSFLGSYATPPTAAAISDAVWDEAIAGHLSSGSTGAALQAAGGAGDPLTNPVPGDYAPGTAGYTLGHLDDQITLIRPLYDPTNQEISVPFGADLTSTSALGRLEIPSTVTSLNLLTAGGVITFAVRLEAEVAGSTPIFSVTGSAKDAETAYVSLVDPTQTRALQPDGTYFWSLTHTSGTGEVTPLNSGRYLIQDVVTSP